MMTYVSYYVGGTLVVSEKVWGGMVLRKIMVGDSYAVAAVPGGVATGGRRGI
jgi:hypothetical protein